MGCGESKPGEGMASLKHAPQFVSSHNSFPRKLPSWRRISHRVLFRWPNRDTVFKILMIGDSGVGKSCLLLRFSDGIFTDSFISTIGVDFKIKTMEVDGQVFKLQIWDTAGQERFRTITSSYYRGAQGIIIAYSITDHKSFENVSKWLREIETFAGRSAFKILVGNKSDLESERAVSIKEAQELAARLNIPFLESSAKASTNVHQIFEQLCVHLKNNLLK
eukprot:TRINITY_DN5671_c0_g1_i1.p1 TRINITY_DN5671_c0_g1~~TRINITY_DN5671_c0_g1_i1.p1  ORF type:complete len:258 (-),score=41.30 TRINITY_DN5671_c0_g1_i1:179-838(-)